MFKKLICVSFFLFFAIIFGYCKVAIPEKPSQSSTQSFKTGEFFAYTVSFGFYTGATAQLSVTDTLYNGVRNYIFKAQAQTIGIADFLYKVRDQYISFVDTATNLPNLSIRDINEGRYHHYNEVTYNRPLAQATSKKTGVHNLTADVQDILSIFFYARNNHFNDSLHVDQLLILDPFFCDAKFELLLRYRGLEQVKTKFGTMECYKFSLCERKNNTVVTLDNMSFWLSRDGNRAPIKVRFQLAVGSFMVELEKFSGTKYPFIFNKSK